MNNQLKQSLDGRLGGMRWGEYEQAEVFRQIHRKELQNVKHVKRGSSLIAIAMTLLFVVMGAAFALTQPPRTEDEHVAAQPTEIVFIPVAATTYENDHFTLTIDSTTCTASEAAFTGTIRMKNPAETMLSLASHTPPGDAGRTILPVDLSCGVSTQLPGDMPMACGSLRELDVLNMTADTTVFRMSGGVASLHEDVTFKLWIDWTDPTDGTAKSDKLTWSIAAPEQPGMLLAEYDLVTVRLADYTAENGVARMALDVTPAKPWYVLNRQEEGKAALTVSAEPLLLYPTFDPQDMLGMVDARDPIAGEMPVTLTQTPEGLRLTAEGPLPAAETLYGYIVLHVYSDAAEAHYDEGFDDHYYEVCVPVVPLEEAVEAAPTATPAPLPQPTATAAPERDDPTGDCIEENEIVRIYLEDTWTDGFTTEATLRIRTIDASNQLQLIPHATGDSNANTWIVELQNPSDRTLSINSVHREATTGDILVSLTDKDLSDIHQDGLLDLSVTITNELNWQEYVMQLRPVIRVPRQPSPRPLYLLSSSDDVPFVQGSLQSTSRYSYIGVMISADQGTAPLSYLLDSGGNALAVGQCCFETGSSLKMFPHVLFPGEWDAGNQYYLLVMRTDKTEILHDSIRLQLSYSSGDTYELLLSTTPNTTLQATESTQTVIHENEYVLITLHSDWYDGRSAILTLQATLKDPDAYAFVESADSTPPDGKLGVALTSMVGWSNESFSRHGWMTLSRPWSLDNSILWQAKAFDIDPDVDELLIGGYLWLTTPSGEETIAINHAIPQTGLWQEYTLTPIAPTETIHLERATLHAGTHASYYDLAYVVQDDAPPLTLRIASVNDVPLSTYSANTTDADGYISTAIVAQTRLAPQTAVVQVCTADGQVLEEVVCQIEEASHP